MKRRNMDTKVVKVVSLAAMLIILINTVEQMNRIEDQRESEQSW